MKNIIKVMFAFITSVSLISSATAGEMTVTGSAKATYNIQSGNINAGKGIGITNEIDFSASGELDNGYTWNYQVQMDPSDDASISGGSIDDTKLTLATPYGTLGFFVSEGGLDVDNSASQSVYGRPTDIGVTSGMQDSFDISGYNNIQLHTPAGLLPFGTSVKFAYASSNDSTINSGNDGGAQQTIYGEGAQQVQITASPIDGLKVGADYFEASGAGDAASQVVQKAESGSIFATYATGPLSVGVSMSAKAPLILGGAGVVTAISNASAAGGNADGVRHYKAKKASVAFNVNDNLSVSYEEERSKQTLITNHSTGDMKAHAIQAAYTMGGMTLAVSQGTVDAVSYSTATDASVDQTLFSMSMAF